MRRCRAVEGVDAAATWFDANQQRYYDRVGVVDILSPGFTLYLWDAAGYTARSNVWLAVFKLRDGAASQR